MVSAPAANTTATSPIRAASRHRDRFGRPAWPARCRRRSNHSWIVVRITLGQDGCFSSARTHGGVAGGAGEAGGAAAAGGAVGGAAGGAAPPLVTVVAGPAGGVGCAARPGLSPLLTAGLATVAARPAGDSDPADAAGPGLSPLLTAGPATVAA
jgi:hypothetical protein